MSEKLLTVKPKITSKKPIVKKEKKPKKLAPYIGIRITHGHQVCALPWCLDTYRSCSHNCLYCFSFDKVQANPSFYRYDRSDFTNVEMEAISDKSVPLDDFRNLIYEGKGRYGFYKGLVAARFPIRWGNNSDSFSAIETYQGVSLEMLKIFTELKYPVHIYTKSKWLVDAQEYIDLIKQNKNMSLTISFTTTDASANEIEPGTDVGKRLELFEALKGSNLITARISPIIPGYTEKYLEDTIKDFKRTGVDAVISAPLQLPYHYTPRSLEQVRKLEEAIDVDLISYFSQNANRVFPRGRCIYNTPRRGLQIPIKKMCQKYGLKYLNCGEGSADMGDDWSCCGTRHDITSNHALNRAVVLARDAKSKGNRVYHKDFFGTMNKQALALQTVLTKNCMNCGSDEYYYQRTAQTYFDTLRSAWDNPRSPYNPTHAYNGMVIDGLDEEGHLVFKFVKNPKTQKK